MSGNFFIKDQDYSENTRNVDSMFKQFSKDRQEVINMLKTKTVSLWGYDSPISKDTDCLFQMGKNLKLSIDEILEKKSNISDTLINYYICPQCKNMKRLIDFSELNKDNSFVLEFGEKTGEILCYDEKDISLYMLKESEPNSVKKAYRNPNIIELAKCSSATCALPSTASGLSMLKQYTEYDYLASDKFTNNILINWFLNSESKTPHIIDMYISFICNNKGYNVYEYLDIGNINSFQEFPEFLEKSEKPSPTAKADDKEPICKDIVFKIIVQLFACLHSLRKFDFSHGSPNSNSLRFKNKPVSYYYDKVHVSSPVTLKLLDFSTSGCSVDKLRLYSKSVVADEELKKSTFQPIIDTVVLNKGEEKVTIYKLKNPNKYLKSSILFMYMKHLGLPVYSASFDAYAFMIILMSERSFYTSVVNNDKLNNFWRNMWVNDEDFDTINYRLNEIHETPKQLLEKDILFLLSDLSLRCDMIEFGWKKIKNF